MKDDNEKALDEFLDTENEKDVKEKTIKEEDVKRVIMAERSGLVERIDKIFVDSNGKQLLREIY